VGARSSAAGAPALRGLVLRYAPRPGINREAAAVATGGCTLGHVFGNIDHTHMKMRMRVQAGTEAVDEGDGIYERENQVHR